MMATAENLITGMLLIIGAGFTLVAAIGLLRLPDLYTRMHAASKAGTLGSGMMLIALAVFAHDQSIVTRALAAVVFFLLTAPISAHLLAKAAYAAGYRLWGSSLHDEMAGTLPKRHAPDAAAQDDEL
ncbi:monovalent cation/H(+) antiporter subunit G [Nitratireductor sp. ZSWI3]|uniref:monovalent cation/H(+) antiporter subunit G n=1 Tax=Nitratireductor sp. ZSWI3 TaxID=2966359 RepID=UPI00215045E0|nr:monovalent cation/H(+) antiporter subunit G [Nitratireductor sp. ZSWI3]MCR4265326.1 monovalent cation/H(+) antiporter subunit G [Nitratireductor sp. ZSWI3]